ncbi:CD166 antigen-like isoform X2 [Pristis pectinata]|nr:CD166 antigen-like isoform X2 [Pristis pectinata]
MATAPALICGLLISVYARFVSVQANQNEIASLKLLVEFGKELQLSCTIPHQNNKRIIRWLQKTSSMEEWEEIAELSGVGVPVDEERFKVLENGTLVILSVSVEDEGQFKCQVGKDGPEDHSVTTVAVFKSPTKPVLDVRYQTFTAGELSEIGTCTSSNGYPVSNITWYKNGRLVVANGNEVQTKVHNIMNQNTRLYTTESTLYYTLNKSDINAEFFCEVVYPSQGGIKTLSSQSLKIDVHYAIENAVIEVEPSTEVINEGESVHLKCTADSNPPPIEYLWEKDGKQISTSAQYTIQSVTKSDEGYYRCTVFDFNFIKQSAVRIIQVKATENNNELDGRRDIPPLAEKSRSLGHQGGDKPLNRAWMVIGIIVTLTLVAFFVSVAYYFCYYGKEQEKKSLEDIEERTAMEPEKVPPTEVKVE